MSRPPDSTRHNLDAADNGGPSEPDDVAALFAELADSIDADMSTSGTLPEPDGSEYDPECGGCQVAAGDQIPPGGLLYASDNVTVNHRIDDTTRNGTQQQWPGWLVVQPRQHVAHLWSLPEAARTELLQVTVTTVDAVRQATDADRVLWCSLGEQADDHLQIHVIATFADHTGAVGGWRNLPAPHGRFDAQPTDVAEAVRRLLTAT